MHTTAPGWHVNPVTSCWELHDERGRMAGQVHAVTVKRHCHEPSFRAWITSRFRVPLPEMVPEHVATTMIYIRDRYGEAISGVVSAMSRESPMT